MSRTVVSTLELHYAMLSRSPVGNSREDTCAASFRFSISNLLRTARLGRDSSNSGGARRDAAGAEICLAVPHRTVLYCTVAAGAGEREREMSTIQ